MKRVLIPALLLAGAGAAVAAWLWIGSDGEEDGLEPATVRAMRREFTSTVLATGAVKPQVGAEVRVGSRISGKVVRLHANIRDRVQKGQVVAELEKMDLEAVVNERKAELELAEFKLQSLDRLFPREIEKAEADVERWKATVALAEKELGRHDELLRQEFIAQQARDEAEERSLVAHAQREAARKSLELVKARHEEELKQARAEVARAKAALANAEVQLSYAVIQAPISGVIGSVSTQEGETVAAGFNAPTFLTIVDLSRLQVDGYVDEVDIGKIVVGQNVVFTVEAFPSRDFEGRVMAIYPKAILQDNVVKYIVAVEVTSPYEGKLRPEMTATVEVSLEARTVLAIPSKAVKRERGSNVVYVKTAGRPETRPVKIGWKDGPWAEVVSGLEEGEEVYLERPGREEGGDGG